MHILGPVRGLGIAYRMEKRLRLRSMLCIAPGDAVGRVGEEDLWVLVNLQAI